MKSNTTPKSVTIRIRLVEDIDCYIWESIGKRTEAHQEAWRYLKGKAKTAQGWDNSPDAIVVNLPFPEVVEQMKKVAVHKGFKVQEHKNGVFTLRHSLPIIPPTVAAPDKIRVDLKWSLWTDCIEDWEQRAPGVLKRMEQAFNGTGPMVEILTGPRKEIRFGDVTISKGQAVGTFACEWDEAHELAQTLGLEDAEDPAFIEALPGSMFIMGIGVERTFKLRTRSFARLLTLIDNEEAELLKDDKATWEEVEKMFSTAAPTH